MAIGPGKYDKLAETFLVETKADAVVLIVFNGDKGNGMSMKINLGMEFEVAIARLQILDRLPGALRHVADTIEKDANRTV